MGLSAFNRARRLAAEQAKQAEVEAIDKTPSTQQEDHHLSVARDDHQAQLKEMNWQDLKALLEAYNLPADKPKGISWDDFAIPKILEHEGF